ncbi:DUF4931 domain-containing protein [Companilactobacillus futsaii]|uniref:DUF4931 domain-containing protein n=1 Tax=Companilactobacillus futsaii JCM 17355 TaxID=1423818 RepID=A0ABR5P5H7_9LACO|nr:DUF4931 domain-containing protein [Companilactobacillus futsaii]KRK91957.1 hypothetical protein FC88_GL000994 [Companilactobacillus futsaii JCM 17355]
MSNKDVLVFEIEQAKGKPRDVEKKKKKDYCPFCDTKNLTNIIEQKNDMIWLENKSQIARTS